MFKLIIDCIETQRETALMMACFFSKFDSDILDFAILLTYLC